MPAPRRWIVVVSLVGCTFDATGLGGAGGASSSTGAGETTGGAASTSTDAGDPSASAAATSDGSTTTTPGTTTPGTTTPGTSSGVGTATDAESSSSTSGCDAMQEYFVDADKDGFGAGEPVLACAAPPGYSPYDGDCDDDAPTVHPAADEVCDGEGVDEDCDDLINEYSAKNKSCGTCSLGYFKNSDHVYWFCAAAVTWDVARSACQKVGADLASIGGNGENDFVRMGIGDIDAWLGGRDWDPDVDNAYTWVDGQPLTYTRWFNNNPNHDDGCMAMTKGDGGAWRDYGCSDETFSYVCESG